MKKFPTYLSVVVGLVIFFFGFAYGSIFAGIPYQDPTPEMSASYDFHFDVSNIILIIGFCVLLLGLIGAAAKFMFKRLGKVQKFNR